MTVQFNPTLNILEEVPPESFSTFFGNDEKLSKMLDGLATSPKQTDMRGYFVQYYTTSTKKPYHWERYDAFNSVKSEEFPNYYAHAKSELEKAKVKYDWSGVKLVSFTFDTLNPLYGADILKD
jgi:hypothetical protein